MGIVRGDVAGATTGSQHFTQTDDAAVIDARAGEIVLDDIALLTQGQYLRLGPDLMIVGPDGQKVLLADYFALETPPDIGGPGAMTISGDLAETLAGPRAPGQVAQAGPQFAQAAEAIGTVTRMDGEVFATRADGTRVRLQSGDEVYQGDVLETGEDGAIGITFVDNTEMSLGADGRMVLDEMIYDPDGGDGSSQFSLVSGVFSFVSGEIAKNGPDAMQVKTPVATIGIRGTKGVIKIQNIDTDGDGEADMRMEVALLDSGEIVVSTFQGSTQVINQAFTGFRVVQISGRNVLTGPSQEEIQSFQVTRDYFQDDGVNTALRYLPSQNQNEEPPEQNQAPQGEVPEQLEPNLNPDAPTLNQSITNQVIKVVLSSTQVRQILGLPPIPVGDPEPVVPRAVVADDDDNTAVVGGGDDDDETGENTQGGDDNDAVPVVEIIKEVTVNGTFDATGSTTAYRVFGGSGSDTVRLGGGNDVVYGGGGNDIIQTNDGDDTVYGGAGADTIIGGSGRGRDVYHGGDRNGADDSAGDKLVYTSAAQGVYVDLALGFASGPDIDHDTITGFEHVESAGGNDVLKGNAAANRLQAGAGNDMLIGGQGNDTLQGGTGDDTYAYLPGGYPWGNDIIDDAGGNDVLDLTQVPGHEPFALYLTDADGDGAADDLVAEYETGARQTVLNHLGAGRMERLRVSDDMDGTVDEYVFRDGTTGTTGNDLLLGGSGMDMLEGGAGDDVMFGNGGDDMLKIAGGSDVAIGGTGDDLYYLTALFTEAFIDDIGGIDTLRVSPDALMPTDAMVVHSYYGLADAVSWDDGAGDTGMWLTFSNGSAVEISDNAVEDYQIDDGDGGLVGQYNIHTLAHGPTASPDLLVGTHGNDVLIASADDDYYAGGDGNDTLEADSTDTLLGGHGDDLYRTVGAAASAIVVDIGGHDTVGQGTETLSHIYQNPNGMVVGVFGDGGSFVLMNQHTASYRIETINVAQGAFNLVPGGAGTNGNDLLIAAPGVASETLSGGDGNDWIFADQPMDSAARTLDGGMGNDTLMGGTGDNTYHYTSATWGHDVIREAPDTGNAGEPGENDTIDLTGANVGLPTAAYRDVDDMVLTFDGGSSIRIEGWYTGSRVEKLVTAEGTWYLSDLSAGGFQGDPNSAQIMVGQASSVSGAFGDDLIFMGAIPSSANVTPGGGNDTIYGNSDAGGMILLNGSYGDDVVKRLDGTADTLLYTFSGDDGFTDADLVDGTLVLTSGGGSVTVEQAALPGLEWVQVDGTSFTVTTDAGTGGDVLFLGSGGADAKEVDGPDKLFAVGGAGNDTFAGGDNGDILTGGRGDDLLLGNWGDDRLLGGDGNDTLVGHDGDDTLYGGDGNDHIIDEAGASTIFGGFGDDTIFADSGIVDGGEGNDRITLDWMFSGDSISGGAGDDIIDFLDAFDWNADGGDGFDQLRLDADLISWGKNIYFHDFSGPGDFTGFEGILLDDEASITLKIQNAASFDALFTDTGTLFIDGDADDVLRGDGLWTKFYETVDGVSYEKFMNTSGGGSRTIYVRQDSGIDTRSMNTTYTAPLVELATGSYDEALAVGVVTSGAKVFDTDSIDFAGGTLRVERTDGTSTGESFSIGNGWFLGGSGLTKNGSMYATVDNFGAAGNPLELSFSSNVDDAVLSDILSSIRFSHGQTLPSVATFQVTVTDGYGNTTTETVTMTTDFNPVWSGAAADDNWETAANWNELPVEGDIVTIDVPGATVDYGLTAPTEMAIDTLVLDSATLAVHDGALVIGNDLQATGTSPGISVHGGVLDLSPLGAEMLADLSVQGGILHLGGDLTVSGEFEWTGGTISGGATVNVTDTTPVLSSALTLEGELYFNGGGPLTVAGADISGGILAVDASTDLTLEGGTHNLEAIDSDGGRITLQAATSSAINVTLGGVDTMWSTDLDLTVTDHGVNLTHTGTANHDHYNTVTVDEAAAASAGTAEITMHGNMGIRDLIVNVDTTIFTNDYVLEIFDGASEGGPGAVTVAAGATVDVHGTQGMTVFAGTTVSAGGGAVDLANAGGILAITGDSIGPPTVVDLAQLAGGSATDGFINVKTLDLDNNSNEDLILNETSIMNALGSEKTLVVETNFGDSVSFDSTGWTDTGAVDGYQVYRSEADPAVELHVDNEYLT